MTYLLGKDEGVDIVKVAASVIIKDILELLVTILSLIIGMLLLVTYYSVNIIVLTAIGITMLFFALPLILIVYLSTNISVTKRLLQFIVRITARIKRKKPSGEFEEKIATQITNFHDVIMIIKKKPKSMIKPMFHHTMAWVCSIAALYLVFIALGSVAGLDKVVITNTIVSTISNQGIALSGFSTNNFKWSLPSSRNQYLLGPGFEFVGRICGFLVCVRDIFRLFPSLWIRNN
jgi:uncharacterized protein (TIRG00374 family)